MRVNREKIEFQLDERDGEVVLRMDSPYSSILEFIQIDNYSGWTKRRLSEVYYIVSEDNSHRVTFAPIYVLQTIDPAPLKEVMAELFDHFRLYQIIYDVSVYGKQMKTVRSELKNYHPKEDDSDTEEKVVFCLKLPTDNAKEEETRVFCHRKICEIVMEEKIHRLQKFIEETAVYDLDDYFHQKSINPKEQKKFVKALAEFYRDSLCNHLQDKMKTYGMENQILVKDVVPYLMDDRANSGSNMKGRAGVRFLFFCYEEAISKMYQIFEKWLNKLNWMALEVQSIACCKPEEVQTYFQQLGQNIVRMPVDSQGKGKPREKIIVFQPKKSKQDFEKLLGTNKRIITGLQFPERNFSTIFQFKKDFEIFIAQDPMKLPRPKVYEDYILVQCDKGQQQRMRKKISKFLQDYMWETVDMGRPAGEFQIGIFTEFYSNAIKVDITFTILEEPTYRLQRENLKKCSEEVEEEIKQLYQMMRREMVVKPLVKPFGSKQPLFQVLPAPEWKSPECLKSLKFLIDDQINLLVRSYGSIANGQGNCIFILYELSECSQCQEILEEEGMMYSEQKLTKNPIVSFQLKYSPFFDGITTWMLYPRNVRNRRDGGWLKRMRIELEGFLGDCKNMGNISFMMPRSAAELMEYFLPCLVDAVRNQCKASNLRQITIFTSLDRGVQLRNSINISLKNLSRRMAIQRISELCLINSDIEKILQYRYYSLKYHDETTEEASPLNSFIFKHERDKKIRTPIFLPSAAAFQQRQLIEYLVCLEDRTYVAIRGKVVGSQKHMVSQNEQLRKIVQLVSSIFVRQNYLVIYGSARRNQFDRRLFMTSDQEADYRKLSELEIDFGERKILPLRKRLQYEIIEQEYIEVFKVKTHPNLLDRLSKLNR